MNERRRVSSGAVWEDLVGYSRAVRVGQRIYVSGTTATGNDGKLVEGDAYTQTLQCIRNVENALQQLGGSLAHVVRTRLFVTDIAEWQAYGTAHSQAFNDVRPCTTMVQVSALIDPRMLVEIEVEAEL